MTLSNHKQNRVSSLDATLRMIEQRGRKTIRLATLGVALAAAVGLGGPAAVLADWNTLEPNQTANERAIALIEGRDPANSPAATAGDAAFQAPTANERSIALTESKEASGDTAFVPMTANQRSILLIESKEAPGGVLAGSVPDTGQ